MAPDHEDNVEAYAEKVKVLADATQMIRSERGGAEGQTDSLFQESSGCFLTDIDRSRRTGSGDNGQTARRAGAICCARLTDRTHLWHHHDVRRRHW